MDLAELKKSVSKRRQLVREQDERTERATALGEEIASLQRDVERFQKRYDTFTALGKERIELPQKSYDQRYAMFVEWEPIRSQKTGHELAADAKDALDHVRGEITKRERDIKQLLAR